MNLLQDPKFKSSYDQCKYKVKLWENEFKKKKGRLPCKLDIREAIKEVRDAYKTYYRLKMSILEESLLDTEGFDINENQDNEANTQESSIETSTNEPIDSSNICLDVTDTNINSDNTWGSHLNNKSTNENEKPKSEKFNVNLSFTQKLFAGSLSSKRLPRKSLSFNRKKSDVNPIKPQSLSQPDVVSIEKSKESFTETLKIEGNIFSKNKVKTVAPTPSVISQPVNIIQQAINNNYNCESSRRLDAGWIQRNTQNYFLNDMSSSNNLSVANEDYDSEDIIGNSDDEQDRSCDLYQIAKKRKTMNNSVSQDISNRDSSFFKNTSLSNHNDKQDTSVSKNALITVDTQQKRLDFSNIFTDKRYNKTEIDNQNVNKEVVAEVSDRVEPEMKKEKSNISISENTSKSKKSNQDKPKSLRKLRNNKVMNYTENEESLCSDDAHISKLNVEAENKKSRSKLEKNSQIEKSSSQTYELEYSIKRVTTAPRVKNLKEIISKGKSKCTNTVEDSGDSSKQQRAEDKLKDRVEAGTLNDNYVQINLKKKIYARGKSTKTFSKYKKQMWKNKKKALYGPDMDMSGCDGGILTCFNCGQAGHFARHCKKAKGDSLMPLDNEEEEEMCAHPTLEQAEKMARESVLARRKPSQIQTVNEDVKNDDSSVIDNSFSENDNNSDFFNDDDDADLLAETERLEQEIAKVDVQKYIDSTVYVKPYYNLTEDGNLIETPKEVFDAMRKFGHKTFRDGQELAIMRILSGKSTLVTLSTGSGKSLCYQLPAYLYSQREPCISLIISPLVSLMEDQVTGIPSFLKAACLHTNQTKVQRSKIMDALNSGNLEILLVSPEAVVAGEKSSGFGSLLRKLPPVAFACIDEAHCVSQWSHNFRPSYLKICRVLKERLGIRTILGLTATATRVTTDSIIEHLSIPDGINGIISNIPLPDNLRLTVSRDGNRDQALLTLILSETFSQFKSIIVYCTRREECQRVSTFLRTSLQNRSESRKRKRFSLEAEAYHAGLSSSRRRSIQKAFMNGDLRIVVATVAFGMGINKSDIRAVIHYNMPKSFESYVQEVGRAGRDGLLAHCHVFLDSQGKDENELRRHSYANSTDRHVIRKLLQRCFVKCSCTTKCPRHEVGFSIEETVQALDIPEENIETLLCYLELHKRQYIELLSHAYVTCKIISYGGPNDIRKAAQNCPPLTMALALYEKEDKLKNIFEFPVIEVASVMGWDSGICKHTLKNLEWISENNQPKRSKLSVQFLNLGFHLMAPGNLTDSELDEALDNLHERVKAEEKTSLMQLHALHTTLTSVAVPNFRLCITEEISEKEKLLKSKIREYFESPKPLELFCSEIEEKPVSEDQIVKDVCSLVCMYRENTFTGRAVARIFYGIQSPNYPAVIWGKCKFWRAHLGTDFNSICQIATKAILRMK